MVGLVTLLVNAVQAQTTVQEGQTQYSLRQCIDIALQNNLQIKQGQVNIQSSELQLKQAKLNRYPTANLSASQALNAGYSINNTTNSFVNQQVSSNNFQAAAGLLLFNGFALQNVVKQRNLGLQSSEQNLLAIRNTVSITVVQNYLNVLTYQEQLDIAVRQVETSRGQLARTEKLVNAGTLAEAELYTLRAQVANDELAVVNAQNNLDLAKLALLQAMNLPNGTPAPGTITVERYQFEDPTVEVYPASAQQVFEVALQVMPDVKAADLQVQSNAMGVQAAKSRLYPILSLNGSLTSLYSSLGLRTSTYSLADPAPTSAYILMNGTQYPVYDVKTVEVSSVNYSFGRQLRSNLNRYVGATLQIPIFNNLQNRNLITSAIITQKSSEITADNTRLTLRQNIETAYTNMLAAANRYRATLVQVESYAQAFRAAESRFNVGAYNSVDYNIAKTNLDKSRANLVQAKYDYIFRTKILDFYQNKPLSF